MKKLLFLLLLPVFVGVCSHLKAQSFFRNLELELGPSVIVSAAAQGARVEASWNGMAELRYNFARLPFDVGLHFGLGAFSRDYARPEAHDFNNLSRICCWSEITICDAAATSVRLSAWA